MPSDWEELYLQTVMEVNRQKVQERIAATRRAIARELKNLENDSQDHPERLKMEKALKALETLEADTKNWKP
jgi:hypothetical protein